MIPSGSTCRSGAIFALWAEHLAADEISTCAQVRLEVLYSAESAREYDLLAEELQVLPNAPCGDDVLARAIEVQARLARHALHHRSVKIAALVIAAAAELAGHVVWHHDDDFDRIARVTQPTQNGHRVPRPRQLPGPLR